MKQRPFIRAHFACAPRGCGAEPGEPCRAYRDSWHGPASGRVMTDVHMARWKAYFGWLNHERGLDAGPAGNDTPRR